MQQNQFCANKRPMILPHNNYNHHHHHHESLQLLSSSLSSCSSRENNTGGAGDCGLDGAASGGSMLYSTSNQVACLSDIYDVVGAAASGSGTTTNSAALVSKSLNPDSLFHFKSSGEMAASVSVRVPSFTAAQLQELERQTLIYKYLMASVPIPHELLLPLTKSQSRVPPSQSNLLQGSVELGILSNNNPDPEPWRCKRTDGKKWRCSRDVVPDQKYCERHSHKSRPRSRKPVELPAHLIDISNRSLTQSNTIDKSYPKASSGQKQQRGLEWFMKGETVSVVSSSNQEWVQMVQSKLESNTDSGRFGEHHREHLNNPNSYPNLGGDDFGFQAPGLDDPYNLFLSPKTVSDQAQTQETRHFIDAWSIARGNIPNEERIGSNCFVPQNEKLPLSSLTLSVSDGTETMGRNENALMGTLVTIGSGRENVGNLRPHWMNHVSGLGSPPGGPLAEALCLGIASSAKSDSNAASPRGCCTSTTTSS